MIIDAHTHMFHEHSLEQLSRLGGTWAKKKVAALWHKAKTKPALVNVQERLGFLDRNGIDLQIVTPPHFMYSTRMPDDIATHLLAVRAINEGMGKLMEASKGKLIAAGTVPLENYEKYGRHEMQHAVKALGLKAVSIASHWYGKPLDSPEFMGFWEDAVALDLPVFIHPADPVAFTGRPYEAQYDLAHNFGWPFETILTLSRLVFSGVIERHPDLKIISHHLGGGIPFFWGRIEETYTLEKQESLIGRVVQSPLHDLFSRIYYDTAVGGNPSAIKCAYDIFGADKLVFATDAPFGPGSGEMRLAQYPKVIESLGLPEIETNKILADNAKKIFNL
jgi:predicted TIM-barrel fold metal-dependent hydrolase